MKNPSNLVGAVFTAALLAACGGGNGGLPSSTPVSVVPQIADRQSAGSASSYVSLYSFKGAGSGDGDRPVADLTVLHGTLYGTTEYGGAGCKRLGCGTVFAIAPSGGESVLHAFTGGDGAGPEAGLINVKGRLYGTTRIGGHHGAGTVFRITASGTETVIHNFGAAGQPLADLIDVSGVLYGTTSLGGAGHDGGVFEVGTTGTGFELLYSFKGGTDGNAPVAPLIDVNGELFGATFAGGSGCNGVGCGTVFEISTSGRERVVHRFKGAPDGSGPLGGLIDVNGTLYGTTLTGGSGCKRYGGFGTVFALNPSSGKERVIYSFKGCSGFGDGANPEGRLVVIGNALYGTTSGGGAYASGGGTVFSVTTSGKETVLHSFGNGSDGVGPSAGLVDLNGTLYGTTYTGGTGDYGTVFSLLP